MGVLVIASGAVLAGPAAAQTSVFDGAQWTDAYFGLCDKSLGSGAADTDCSDTYYPHAADLSLHGNAVVGTNLFPTEGQQYSAFLWLPDPNAPAGAHTIVWLPKPFAAGTGTNVAVERPDIAKLSQVINPEYYVVYYPYESFGLDIDAEANTAVGSASFTVSANTYASGFQDVRYLAPVVWTGSGTTWGATLLPVNTPDYIPAEYVGSNTTVPIHEGEAFAINDAGTLIVGWEGNERPRGSFFNPPPLPRAVYWSGSGTTWSTPVYLDSGGLPVRSNPSLPGFAPYGSASIANDVSDGDSETAVIVGWYGATTQSNMSSDYLITGIGTPLSNELSQFDSTWFNGIFPAQPFAWTAGTGMRGLDIDSLPLPDAPDSYVNPGSLRFGEARAVSRDGTAAVGWSGVVHIDSNEMHDSYYRATRWNTATLAGTLLGNVTAGQIGGDAVSIVGTVANAVDGTGKVIVGFADYQTVDDYYRSAVFWEDDGVGGYTSTVLQDFLASKIRADKLAGLRLLEGTGVRVNETQAGEREILIIGDYDGCAGSLCDPMFLARVGNVSGLTSPTGQRDSLPPIADIADSAAADVANHLGTLADIAENPLCTRPRGAAALDKPWCFFAFGSATGFWTDGVNGSDFIGDIGLARFHDDNPDNSHALSAGVSRFAASFDGGTHFVGSDVHVGAYAAHLPEEGWQLVGAGSLSWLTGIDVTRVYADGSGTASSRGSTGGVGWGLLGRIGRAFLSDDGRKRVTPYIQIDYARADIAGYTESGGPFPAQFNAMNSWSADLRLGLSGERRIAADKTLFGSVAWAHRLAASAGLAVANILVADCGGTPPAMPAFCGLSSGAVTQTVNWFEGQIGARRELSEDRVVSASLTASLAKRYLALTGVLKYGKAF